MSNKDSGTEGEGGCRVPPQSVIQRVKVGPRCNTTVRENNSTARENCLRAAMLSREQKHPCPTHYSFQLPRLLSNLRGWTCSGAG